MLNTNVVLLLKKLGLQFYTLIIVHKCCIVLSILNKSALQMKLQNFVTHYVFLNNIVNSQQQQQLKKQTLKPLRGRDLIPGPLASKADA